MLSPNGTHFSLQVLVRIPPLLRTAILVLGPLVTLTGLAAPAFSQAHVDSAAVAETIDRFHQALAQGDSVAALLLLAEDAIIVESGSIESRQEYRAHHLPADIAFARAVKETRSPVRVNVRGDVAWATATSTTRGDYRRRRLNATGAELMVLTRVGPGWKINAIHWSSRNLP